MKQIIAIGGGDLGRPDAKLQLERYILAQAKKDNPKICFLPQASNESLNYITKFYETFLSLGARPSWISLFGRVEPTWKEKLLAQDIIYVGGGNTRSMLALWREWGVDRVLKEAYERGIILCGVSAGAICWFQHGITDSVWPLGVLDCLGFIDDSCCPHYDTEPERKPTYLATIQSGTCKPGIALCDDVAAHFIDGKLHKIVSAAEHKKGYYVCDQGERELDVLYFKQ